MEEWSRTHMRRRCPLALAQEAHQRQAGRIEYGLIRPRCRAHQDINITWRVWNWITSTTETCSRAPVHAWNEIYRTKGRKVVVASSVKVVALEFPLSKEGQRPKRCGGRDQDDGCSEDYYESPQRGYRFLRVLDSLHVIPCPIEY